MSLFMKLILRCCLYVCKLEHGFFSKSQNQSLPKAPQKKENNMGGDNKTTQERLNLTFNLTDEDETWYVGHYH